MNRYSSITILLIFLLTSTIHAQNRTASPRLEPDPKAFEYHQMGGSQGNYTWQELAEISLWASGNTANTSDLQRIITIAETIKADPDFPASQSAQAEFILNYMHRNILRSYSLHQTRIDTMLSNGRFNCVSSAVLYTILCKAVGIDTSGVITKDHAFVIANIDGNAVDVETTNRYGFDPGNRKEFHDQFGTATGFAYVPAQNYRDRQTINQIELVSLIFNNRISEHERHSRFAEAVPLAVDRAALLLGSSPVMSSTIPQDALFKDPYNELLDRISNYGSVLLRRGQEDEALQWANAASAIYPNTEKWKDFYFAAVNNRVSRFLRARQIEEARTFLESYKVFISDANYAQLDTVLLNARATDFHNRFATEWNKGNHAEAERILNEGLTEFPDNRQLLNNRATIERNRR